MSGGGWRDGAEESEGLRSTCCCSCQAKKLKGIYDNSLFYKYCFGDVLICSVWVGTSSLT